MRQGGGKPPHSEDGPAKPAPTCASRRAGALGVRQLAAALGFAAACCRGWAGTRRSRAEFNEKNGRARQAAMRQGGGKPPHSEDGPAKAGPYVRFAQGGGSRSAAA